jgi:hypothetical protein
LTSDDLKIRFQLSARLRNGASCTAPRSSGIARLSFTDSNSAIEKRPNTLSLSDALQSMRTSP